MWSDVVTHPLVWFFSLFLGILWVSRILEVFVNRKSVPDITSPEYEKTPAESHDRLPRVSIIVPARNEAEHIENALLSLLQLDYPDYEVIAVDDRSEDATGATMDRLDASWRGREEAFHHLLKVLHVDRLPAGWLGKVHAMWMAAKEATGEWLLFTDADVVFRPDALRRAMVYGQKTRADHVVVFPTMILEGIGERMMMAFFQSQFVFSHRPWKVADPMARDSIGVGAFNLLRRHAYDRIGTYAALRMSVLDDMDLGELVKQNGFTQRCAFGRDLLRLRWVVGPFGMVRNLTKNIFAILRFNVALAVAGICGIVLINLGPFVGFWLARGCATLGYAVAMLCVAVMYLGMATRSDISPLYFFLHPVGTLIFAYAVARSMVLTIARGGIVWRGTWYSLQQLKQFSKQKPRWDWL